MLAVLDFGFDLQRALRKNLHQAAEASYKTILLVFTNYNPNEHLLDLLIAQTNEFSPELKDVFPRSTQEEKDLFGLLDYAYIGARYDPGYQISPSGLEYLASEPLGEFIDLFLESGYLLEALKVPLDILEFRIHFLPYSFCELFLGLIGFLAG